MDDPRVRDRIAEVVRTEIRALGAYPVATATGMIKLDAMESPYPLPEALRQRMLQALAEVPVNRYPDGAARELREQLRESLRLPPAAGVMVGNGSDELIALITTAVARPGSCMLCPDPTFVMYRIDATLAGMRYVAVSLAQGFALDSAAFLAAIERERPALVFLAYPNNPTGNRFPAEEVERIVRAAPGLVVVDEAYHAFADHSFLDRVTELPNLLVLRTLSKVGLAGIRLGYAVAAQPWIDELDKVRAPYNVNALTQAAALTVLRDPAALVAWSVAIRRDRALLAQALAALPGVVVFPTETNFVLARVPGATRLFDGLQRQGILVKNLHGWHPLLADCLRITVGTPEQNAAVVRAMEALCA